jgi:hypothetical protein
LLTYVLVAVAAALIHAAARVLIAWLALRGSEPGQRPAILRALAQCLRFWPPRGP